MKNKRGQVAIFIILAVLVVAAGVLIYMFYPDIRSTIGTESKNPSAFIQSCIEDDIKNSVELLSSQGGSISPENYFMYENEKIGYLCYTKEYYKPCVMQQPMLKEHIESEIKNEISEEVKECFDLLKADYEKRAYNVNLREGDVDIELLPKKIVVAFNHSLTVAKKDSEKYDSFRVVLDNNLYELVSITNSILNWEARYGDSETTSYMNYYRDLKVEKRKQTDGTTIYILTNRNSGDKFQFASRSIAWPAGYGTNEVRL